MTSYQNKPAHTRIKNHIEQEILQGRWEEGALIYSEQELCREFDVSRITAMRVLNDLETMGYLQRQRGRGSVLMSSRKKTNSRIVHLISPMQEHLHAPLSRMVMKELSDSAYHVFGHNLASLEADESWESLLNLSGGILICEGMLSEAVERHINRSWRQFSHILRVNNCRETEYPKSQVVTDTAAAITSQVSHAIGQGYDKIIYYTYPHTPYPSARQIVYSALELRCRTAGIEPLFRDMYREELGNDHNIKYLADLLKATGKNCAVLADSDFRASFAVKAASVLGWKIGPDIGIVGFWNTPWSEALDMTSVSIQEAEMARQVARLVKADQIASITVPSVLVERGSTLRVPGDNVKERNAEVAGVKERSGAF